MHALHKDFERFSPRNASGFKNTLVPPAVIPSMAVDIEKKAK
jgi:hypothetical protein